MGKNRRRVHHLESPLSPSVIACWERVLENARRKAMLPSSPVHPHQCQSPVHLRHFSSRSVRFAICRVISFWLWCRDQFISSSSSLGDREWEEEKYGGGDDDFSLFFRFGPIFWEISFSVFIFGILSPICCRKFWKMLRFCWRSEDFWLGFEIWSSWLDLSFWI